MVGCGSGGEEERGLRDQVLCSAFNDGRKYIYILVCVLILYITMYTHMLLCLFVVFCGPSWRTQPDGRLTPAPPFLDVGSGRPGVVTVVCVVFWFLKCTESF